jgi:hypothetical protein
VILAFDDSALAQGQALAPVPAPPAAVPSAETLKNWRNGMVQVPPPSVAAPNGGCFTATYPNIQWQEVPCAQGVTVPPFPPVPARTPAGGEGFSVGGGVDPIAGVTSGQVSTAVGSFDSVSGVTSIMGEFGANDYSFSSIRTLSAARSAAARALPRSVWAGSSSCFRTLAAPIPTRLLAISCSIG